MLFGLKDLLLDESDSLSGSTGINDDLALMEEEGEEESSEEESSEEEEGKTEEESGEEEAEEESEEPVAELAPHERPTYTDVKTAFPDLFKKFPQLKDIMFRERAYTEEFSDITDARQAKENSEAFGVLEADIINGTGVKFFESLKERDVKSLRGFASKILPALAKVDVDAHWIAANPVLENVLKAFQRAGKDNEDVQKAAKLFAEFMWPEAADSILSGKTTFITEIKEKEEDPERTQFRNERANAFRNDLGESTEKSLKAFIIARGKDGRTKIDPEDELSDYIKDIIIEKISNTVKSHMKQDKAHMKYMNGLWKKATDAGFASEWKSRINDAFLARARQLVPSVRSHILSEFLGSQARRSDRTKQVVKKQARSEVNGTGRESKSAKYNPNKKIDYRKTSDEDLINDNITYLE